MGRWAKKIEIKDLLTDDNSPENAVKTGEAIAARLRIKLYREVLDDDELEDIVRDFEALDEAGRFALSAFNETLERLYDWADTERVWLGL